MEDSSEGRWQNLICPPSYHPSLTQARMVGGHHCQVVSHQRNSKTSFLGPETAPASLTHACTLAYLHTEIAEMSEKCFQVLFFFCKGKPRNQQHSISHDPSPTPLYSLLPISCINQGKPCLPKTVSQNYSLS